MALPSELKLLIACAGIFFSFSYFAVLQEDVYSKRYGEAAERFRGLLLAARDIGPQAHDKLKDSVTG